MLILATTTDKLQLITTAAAALDVHTSWVDLSGTTVTPGKTNTAITTATTTDIVAAPAASTVRNLKTLNIRNKDVISDTITVVYNQNATIFELHKVTLAPADILEYVEGVGFFKVSGVSTVLNNESTTSQTGFAADTYLAGSSVTVPLTLPNVGTRYRLWFDVTKTAAGTAAPTINIRYGTAGSVADASIASLVFGAGTAAIDSGLFEVHCTFRTVGAGTAATFEAISGLTTNLTTTGLSTSVKAKQATSAGFDSTVANSIIGASYNGGASAAHTIQLVIAELVP